MNSPIDNAPRGSLSTWNNSLFGNYNYASSLAYPAPFLNYEKHLIPESFRKAAELLCHHFFTDSNINSGIEVMSVYPITEFMYPNKPKKEIREKWDEILRKKKLKSFNKKQGIDYFLYGNTAVSLYKPFQRHGTCVKCNSKYNLNSTLTKWEFKSLKFKVFCSKCKSKQELVNIKDIPLSGLNALKKINLIKWNIFDLTPREHFTSSEKKWRLTIPQKTVNEIIAGDSWYISLTQIDFIEAVQSWKAGTSNKPEIEFDENQIMVIQRPMPSMPGGEMLGWGLPLAISALRDLMFKNTIRRAQSVLLYENILPFRIFSPQQISADPSLVDNGAWVNNLQFNYQAWRKNPQHIMTSGVPINIQQAGGDGKILSMFPEMQLLDKNILKSINTPAGIIEGNLTFSGGSIALRVFENTLINFTSELDESNTWIVEQIAEIIDFEKVEVAYMPFKTGDDPQYKQLQANAAEKGWISKDAYVRTLGYDYETEQIKVSEELVKEMVMNAIGQAKAQAKAQKTIEYIQTNNSSAFNNGTMPIDPQLVDQVFLQLSQLPPEQQKAAIQSVQQQNPLLARELSNRNDLSPQAGIDFLTELQQTSPEIANQRIQSLEVDDPIKMMITKAVADAMSMYLPTMANGALQPQQQGAVSNTVDMRPAPVQKPPMRNYQK